MRSMTTGIELTPSGCITLYCQLPSLELVSCSCKLTNHLRLALPSMPSCTGIRDIRHFPPRPAEQACPWLACLVVRAM